MRISCAALLKLKEEKTGTKTTFGDHNAIIINLDIEFEQVKVKKKRIPAVWNNTKKRLRRFSELTESNKRLLI